MPLFIKKKTWRHVLPMCPFSFLQTIRKIAWSKCDNSSELSNFDTIVKIIFFFKNADCWQKEKKKGEKAEAASCRNLMKFFSRYIKCFTSRKIVWTCNEVSIFNQHSSAVTHPTCTCVMCVWIRPEKNISLFKVSLQYHPYFFGLP